MYEQGNDRGRAVDILLALLDSNTGPLRCKIRFRLGIAFELLGDFPNSLKHFDHLLQDSDRSIPSGDVWLRVGYVYEQQVMVS